MGLFRYLRRLLLFLILSLIGQPALYAACQGDEDPAFTLLIAQGDYAGTMHLVLKSLHIAPAEANRFYLDPDVGAHSDDVHGQADADTEQVHIDPGLFLEGESGACQGILHELQHLRQFTRDHQRLHALFSKMPAPGTSGWSGCDRDELQAADAAPLEAQAYSCLQDNELSTHSAAGEIEAVLAQLPQAAGGRLRDEDMDYLRDNLKTFADHSSMLTNPSNEAYYLPAIKKEDIRIFCRGGLYIHRSRESSAPFDGVWLPYCKNFKG